MNERRKSLGSDLRKVDLYENSEADYVELPEITEEEFARAEIRIAGQPVRGRPPVGSSAKRLLSLRLDPEIETRFRSSGPGWQTRMNTFLLHNETILKMIVEFDEAIQDMEALIADLRSGELDALTEPVEMSVAKVERNIQSTKEITRSLRRNLVWDPIETVS